MNDIQMIFRLTGILKFLNYLKAALTVGIIGFTVFKIIMLFKEKSI